MHAVRLIVVACLAIGAPSAQAQAFRCNSNLIREGMTANEIREKCRAPDLVRRKEEPVYARLESGATVQTGVDITEFWFFDRGPNEYVVQITLRESVADKVELLTIRDLESLPDE